MAARIATKAGIGTQRTFLLFIFPSVYGNDYLRQQGIPYETSWDLWVNTVGLSAISLVLLTFSYLRLRFINKYT